MGTTITNRADVAPEEGVKAPCLVATTTSITLSGLQTIDGVLTVANNRVLVKNQADASENGIYCASSSSWTRTPDFNDNSDLKSGMLTAVSAGSTQTGMWIIEFSGDLTLGATNLTITQDWVTEVQFPSNTQSGNYTLVAGDNRGSIEYTGTGGHTYLLPDATTINSAVTSGYYSTIQNSGTSALTIDCATASDVINGSTSGLVLETNESATFKINNAVNGYIINANSEVTKNKILESPIFNTQVTGTAIKNENDMASDSAGHLATQESIKAYVDTNARLIRLGNPWFKDATGVTSKTVTSSFALMDTIPTITGLVVGDIIFINIQVIGTKGVSAGSVLHRLLKNASSTANFESVSGIQFYIADSYYGASENKQIHISAMLHVITAGDLDLDIFSKSNGSDLTSASFKTANLVVKTS